MFVNNIQSAERHIGMPLDLITIWLLILCWSSVLEFYKFEFIR